MQNSISDLVFSLGSRVNPEVNPSDIVDFLIKRYSVNPHTLVIDIRNAKMEKAKECVHRLIQNNAHVNCVKCIICDLTYQCEYCSRLLLLQKPQQMHDQINNINYHITIDQCSQCMNQIEHYVCGLDEKN